MNITKERMLERIREWKGAFDTHPDKMDEWSLCFMEDYKVYDAIRSLIEKSGKIITLNLKTGETKTTWEPAAKTLIESSGDKANENKGAEKVLESGPHAEEPLVKPAAPPSPAPSPGPSATPTIIIPVDNYFFVRDGEKTALYEKRDDGQPGNLICEIPQMNNEITREGEGK